MRLKLRVKNKLFLRIKTLIETVLVNNKQILSTYFRFSKILSTYFRLSKILSTYFRFSKKVIFSSRLLSSVKLSDTYLLTVEVNFQTKNFNIGPPGMIMFGLLLLQCPNLMNLSRVSKTPKNRFQLSAGLNLEKLNSILIGTNPI